MSKICTKKRREIHVKHLININLLFKFLAHFNKNKDVMAIL